MEKEALEVVKRLVREDDQSVEARYLGGWCLWLLGGKREVENAMDLRTMKDGLEDRDDHIASLLSSRWWLHQSLTLYQSLDYEDDRLRDHAMELVAELDKRLQGHDVDGVEYEGAEAGGEEEESEEVESTDEDEDEEMDST